MTSGRNYPLYSVESMCNDKTNRKHTLFLTSGVAPDARRYLITSICPLVAARYIGVTPQLSAKFTSAPCYSKIRLHDLFSCTSSHKF